MLNYIRDCIFFKTLTPGRYRPFRQWIPNCFEKRIPIFFGLMSNHGGPNDFFIDFAKKNNLKFWMREEINKDMTRGTYAYVENKEQFVLLSEAVDLSGKAYKVIDTNILDWCKDNNILYYSRNSFIYFTRKRDIVMLKLRYQFIQDGSWVLIDPNGHDHKSKGFRVVT